METKLKYTLSKLSKSCYQFLNKKKFNNMDFENLDPKEWDSKISDKPIKIITLIGSGDWIKPEWKSYDMDADDEIKCWELFNTAITIQLNGDEMETWKQTAEKIDRILSYKKAKIDPKVLNYQPIILN